MATVSDSLISNLQFLAHRSFYRTEMMTGILPYDNVEISEDAQKKLLILHGWILGLLAAGKEDIAEKAYRDIRGAFRYLSEYCNQDGINHCKTKVFVDSDHTFHGFTVDIQSTVEERQILYGGLIYSGPGAGETFTVHLTPPKTYWTLHT